MICEIIGVSEPQIFIFEIVDLFIFEIFDLYVYVVYKIMIVSFSADYGILAEYANIM